MSYTRIESCSHKCMQICILYIVWVHADNDFRFCGLMITVFDSKGDMEWNQVSHEKCYLLLLCSVLCTEGVKQENVTDWRDVSKTYIIRLGELSWLVSSAWYFNAAALSHRPAVHQPADGSGFLPVTARFSPTKLTAAVVESVVWGIL